MLKSRFAALCGALAAVLIAAPIVAEAPAAQAQSTADQARQARSQGRMGDQENNRGRRGHHEETEAPEVSLANAQAALTAASASCQVTEAKLLGKVEGGSSLYEAVCASGPGYLVVASTPPQAMDCILLKASADAKKAEDPEADVGTVCTLPANTNEVAVFAGYAQQAGVTCQVDQGKAIGQSSTGQVIYEVGCAGSDGAWVEQKDGAWVSTPCLQIMASNGQCQFTTKAEQIADLQKLLTPSNASDCTVTDLRLMGQNDRGQFIEAKCATEGEGYIARVQEGAVQQVYACNIAQRIGGGCTLTEVPPLPEDSEQ